MSDEKVINVPVRIKEIAPDFTAYKGYSPRYGSGCDGDLIILVPIPAEHVIVTQNHEYPDDPDFVTSTDYTLTMEGYKILLNSLAKVVSDAHYEFKEMLKSE